MAADDYSNLIMTKPGLFELNDLSPTNLSFAPLGLGTGGSPSMNCVFPMLPQEFRRTGLLLIKLGLNGSYLSLV
jgi:hypothetical protein